MQHAQKYLSIALTKHTAIETLKQLSIVTVDLTRGAGAGTIIYMTMNDASASRNLSEKYSRVNKTTLIACTLNSRQESCVPRISRLLSRLQTIQSTVKTPHMPGSIIEPGGLGSIYLLI